MSRACFNPSLVVFWMFFSRFSMNLQKIKLLSWNVRGLGCVNKGNVVRNTIKNSRCDLCLLQEMKCNSINYSIITKFLPSFFNQDVAFNLAQNSAGGVLIAWKHSFTMLKSWSTKHTVTVVLRQNNSGQVIAVSNVYGPSDDALKPQFILELRSLASLISTPWLIVGDFNLVRWLTDRSASLSNFTLMQRFNEFITAAGLVDTPLRNRLFTWSSKRPAPVFSKLDRVFTSTEWVLSYPVITLQALEILISDHAPLLLTCKGLAQRKKQFKLECFWFNYEVPKEIVHRLWNSSSASPDPMQTFHSTTKILHKALTLWQEQTFGHIDKKLQECKDEILQIDRMEETRLFSDQEFRRRIQLREVAFELANNIEQKWRQRSRCNWLANGDKNTRFFHAMASARLRKNMVLSIQEEGETITEPDRIMQVFANSVKQILGNSSQVTKFEAKAMYPTPNDLRHLAEPFTLEELDIAVRQLSNNKASGADGLPNEFLKLHWNDLKMQVLDMMGKFYDSTLNLQPYNEANIIMIPKKDPTVTTSDFRPISVINLIPKFISKVLSNRLRSVLPDLISTHQTAFVHGHQIAENFVTTRELLHHVSQVQKPAVFAKVDFKKTFDTVEWEFLYTVMEARGFPSRWISWMRTIWSTSSYRVCLNGQASDSFIHKRGLRQGDPLSPMLFILAVDVFQRMVHVANSNLQISLTHRISEAITAFQYADDTAVIASADVASLISFKLILRMFSAISGLKVNFNKSTYVPLNIAEEDIHWVTAIMGFTRTDFPVQYLGMPLTIKAPSRALFLPLIENVERRLAGWQSRLISRGGRLQLVKSVLSSIPLYYMHCFLLPKWVIARIDRARRHFLWGKKTTQVRGISLCNWQKVCLSVEWGGMGVPDLALRNISLLLRWWWKGYNNRDSMWGSLLIKIRWQGDFTHGPALWARTGSFFWSQLHGIKHIFTSCTSWTIGDGRKISYWFDDWGIGILAAAGTRQVGGALSIRQASALQGFMRDCNITFTNDQDELRWNLTTDGVYSAKSAYAILANGGKLTWHFEYAWHYHIPPPVRVFIFLLLQHKILTRDVLLYRGFNCSLPCVMCSHQPIEQLTTCFFSVHGRSRFGTKYPYPLHYNCLIAGTRSRILGGLPFNPTGLMQRNGQCSFLAPVGTFGSRETLKSLRTR